MATDAAPESPSFHIREATADDVIGIVYVQATTWIDQYPSQSLNITEHDIRGIDWHGKIPQWQHVIKSSGYKMWVAGTGAHIYGFVAVLFKRECHELYEFNVLPEYQSRGIGSALLDTALGSIDKDMFLQVATYNRAAKRLYQRYNFVQTGARGLFRFPSGKTIPTLHMRRPQETPSTESETEWVTRKRLSEMTGVRESTIKWYSEQGLMPHHQSDTRRRRYFPAHEAIRRLDYIRQLQHRGWSLSDIGNHLA